MPGKPSIAQTLDMWLSERMVDERSWRSRLHEIIFEADTPAGKAFDIALIVSIVLSVAITMLESVAPIRQQYGRQLYQLEWFFTIIFSIEYVLRIMCVYRPISYVTSFFGLIDFFAVLPTYMSLMVPGAQHLMTLRVLRLVRVFRIFKLVAYLNEANVITRSLYASARKISVFILGVLTLVTFLGSLMYVVEGEANGFTSVPKSIYWAVVTLTTVGYGDIAPQTALGQTLAVVVMLLGYSIIAVPTGIVTAEFAFQKHESITTRACRACSQEGHESDAVFCKYCGALL